MPSGLHQNRRGEKNPVQIVAGSLSGERQQLVAEPRWLALELDGVV